MPIFCMLLGYCFGATVIWWTTKPSSRTTALVFNLILLVAALMLLTGFVAEVGMRGGALPVSR